MKQLLFIFALTCFKTPLFSQQFIEKATIEFEVTTNLKKSMSNDSWAEKMKDNMSDLKISYYNYSFANNKSIYKFERWSPKTKIAKYEKDEDEENIWFYDFTSKTMNSQKQIAGTAFVMNDSIGNIEWKITNENREIAGYNCRKAVGKIFDDVYVFAFYTDDITISGGPCSINGLPGMILGLTIPRLYTSFIATKVTTSIISDDIKPVLAKKTYNSKELKTTLTETTKDWFSWGDDKEENKRQKNLFFWNAFL